MSFPFWRIIAIGMVLRIVWILLVPVAPVSDSNAYDVFAQNIWQHGVYGWEPDTPSAYWAVGTSAITAATYAVLGQTYWGVVVLNLLTSLLIMVLLRPIGTRYFGEHAAFWSVVIVAFWPNLIFFCSILSSELYFIALTLGGLYFWSRKEGPFWLNLLLCGLVWGAACYVRPVIVLFPAAMLIAAFSQGIKATGIAAFKTAVVIALIVATVSPWTLRNAEVIGKPYLVSSNFGPNLWMGNHEGSDGGYTPLPPEVRGMSEVAREEYLGKLAKDYIRANPGQFMTMFGKRLVQLHTRETIGVVWNETALLQGIGTIGVLILKLVATGYWVALVLGAVVGVALRFRSDRLGALFHPVFGGWAYFTAVHAVIVSGDRYHMPSAPFVALLAGVVLAHLAQRFTSRQRANT